MDGWPGWVDSVCVNGRVVSPVFIGRGGELGRLGAALERAAAGEPAVVVVAGEAGVGKSRLVAELLAARAPADARVLAGECSGFAPGSLPYEPVVRLLRALVRSGGGVADLPGVAQPALRLLLPELGLAGEVTAGGRDLPEQAQVFSQLEAVFDAAAAAAPLVLVIEDLHWADRSSLEFLAYLCHGLHHQRMAIVCTYRDDEVPAAPVLGAWLADRRHDPRLTEVPLARFTVAELGGQVAAILGQAADPELVAALHARSLGNAYYTEMLLAAAEGGQAGGGPAVTAVPAALRETLLARSARVAAQTRDMLAVIAVAGRPVDHDAAATACARLGIGEDALLAGLREAVDHHLLIPVTDPPGYAFRHALLAEATYGQLLPGERRRLHSLWAEVLEERLPEGGQPGSGTAAEIAAHHHQAGHRSTAFGWDLRAATAAEQVGGFAEAAGCYRRMLTAWDQVRDPEQHAATDQADILTRLALAEELAGDVGSVHLHLEKALALVNQASDPMRAAMLLDRLSWSLYIIGRPAAALTAAAAAVELVPESPPSLPRVAVLVGLGRLQMLVGHGTRAGHTAETASAAAERISDPFATALAAELQARVAWLTGRPEALRLGRQALRLVRRTGEHFPILISLEGQGEALEGAGDYEGVLQVCYGGYERTRLYGGANYGSWMMCRAAITLLVLGRTDEAKRALDTALRVRPSGILDMYTQLCSAHLAMLRGDFDAGRQAIERCRSGAPEPRPFGRLYCAAAAELELWAGEPDRGFSLAVEGLLSVAGTDLWRHTGLLPWLAVRAAADRTELARASQDHAAEARALADAEELPRIWPTAWPMATLTKRDMAMRALLDAEYSRLAGCSDPGLWARAARYWRACSRPHQAAYAAWRQAEALLAQHGTRATAASCLRDSHALAARIGAQPLQREIETLAGYARISLETPAPPPQPAPIAPPLQALTSRERDVLDALAAGLTNRQIADRLYISPRTAAVHVSHVLHKLGVPDRVQAAHLARKLHAP